MRRLPAVTGRVVIDALQRAGVDVIRIRGSHYFLRHRTDLSRQVVVPAHRDELPPGTLRTILRQARLDRAEFLDLL
jgi:predicted RNA binding protein YcfA (HicA-like mRNA interferase family)